jgi:hypothetical protein
MMSLLQGFLLPEVKGTGPIQNLDFKIDADRATFAAFILGPTSKLSDLPRFATCPAYLRRAVLAHDITYTGVLITPRGACADQDVLIALLSGVV